MAAPYFTCIHGKLVIVGYEPDGDSVRFIADDVSRFDVLKRADRLRLSPRDHSVQLRFEGVDAPELHYGKDAQPLGDTARDALLRWIGFTAIAYDSHQATKVVSSEPAVIPAVILAQMVEANGRPVSYVLVQSGQKVPTDGAWVHVDDALLDRTLNLRLLAEGQAYYTVYTSTPVSHRSHLRAVAAKARAAGLELWRRDRTTEWSLTDQASIGPDGQLILPKLFRRCTDYLKAVDHGFSGNLADWLISTSATPSRDENDRVLLHDSIEVHLSDLLKQRNQHIAFQPDTLDITFVEK
ncbi:MAG TPA: thermonuclease family protein [Pseudonocardiaceae bacterium]|nr:thermonuclease family protein [Pseudonocardiaceae bacterium]